MQWRWLVVLWVAVIASGCGQRPPVATGCYGYTKAPTFTDAPTFQGSNAFGRMLEQVCDFAPDHVAPRSRVPGTPGHAAAEDAAVIALTAAGWKVQRQDFTGADYDALDKGNVSYWAGPPMCKAADRARLLGLAFSNVLAEDGTGDRVYLLMAHYDAKRNATEDVEANHSKPVPGANDGASGVGVLIEAARVLRERDRSATLRLLLDDGEDGFEDCHPLAGSVYYARTLPADERSRIAGVLLLDMVGDAAAKYCYAGNSDTLRSRFVEAARAQAADALSGAPTCAVYDDHTAFTDLRVPALDVIDFRRPGTSFPPYWHTVHDTPDKLSPAMLGEVGRTVVAMVDAFTAS